jgi:hypothetical protein
MDTGPYDDCAAAAEDAVIVEIWRDTSTLGDKACVLMALERAREAQREGRQVKLRFMGAGTRWVRLLCQPGHELSALFAELRGALDIEVCRVCERAYAPEAAAPPARVPPRPECEPECIPLPLARPQRETS